MNKEVDLSAATFKGDMVMFNMGADYVPVEMLAGKAYISIQWDDDSVAWLVEPIPSIDDLECPSVLLYPTNDNNTERLFIYNEKGNKGWYAKCNGSFTINVNGIKREV